MDMDHLPNSSHDGVLQLPWEPVGVSSTELPSHLAVARQSEPDDVVLYTEGVLSERPDINRSWLNEFIKENVVTYGDRVVDFASSSHTQGPSRYGGPSLSPNHQRMGKSSNDDQILGMPIFDSNVWNTDAEYPVLALDATQADLISNAPENSTFSTLYAPTPHQELLNLGRNVAFPNGREAAPAKTNKGKGREYQNFESSSEPHWMPRDIWRRSNEAKDIIESLQQPFAAENPTVNQNTRNNEVDQFECGCCFSTFALDHVVSCAHNHLFCRACVTTHSESLLFLEKTDIPCISTAGCPSFFPDEDLRRCLPQKLFRSRQRLIDRRSIQEAGLPMGECPFCDWFCALFDEQAPEFFCGGCGVTSCIKCKRHGHLPKTCEEVQEDNKREGRHVVEEAMTSALIRRCPQCKKPFIKEDGCNKMTCPFCGTVSCYICRQSVKNGYEHFQRIQRTMRKAAGSSRQQAKCPLMDSVEERHVTEVIEAATRAIEDIGRKNPDIKDGIWVDLPEKPRTRRAQVRRRVRHPPMAPVLAPVQLPNFAAFAAPHFHVQTQPMAQLLPAQLPGLGPVWLRQPNLHWAPHLHAHHVGRHINGHFHLHNGPPVNPYVHADAAPIDQVPPFVFGQTQYIPFTAPFIRPEGLTMYRLDAPQDHQGHMCAINCLVPQHTQPAIHGLLKPQVLPGPPTPPDDYVLQHVYPQIHPGQVTLPAQTHGALLQNRHTMQYFDHGRQNGLPQTGPGLIPVSADHHQPFPIGGPPTDVAPGHLNNPSAQYQVPQRWVEPQLQTPGPNHVLRAIQQGSAVERNYYLHDSQVPSRL